MQRARCLCVPSLKNSGRMGGKNYPCSCPPHSEILRQSTAQSTGFPRGWLAGVRAHLALSKPCVLCPVAIALAAAGENPCALGAGCARVGS